MKAAVLFEPGQPLRGEGLDLEGPRDGEVLFRKAASGVCHSCGAVETVGPGVRERAEASAIRVRSDLAFRDLAAGKLARGVVVF